MPLGDPLYSMLLKSLAAKEPRTPGAHLEAHVDDTMFGSTASQPGHCWRFGLIILGHGAVMCIGG